MKTHFILTICLVALFGLVRADETVDNKLHFAATFPGPVTQGDQAVETPGGKMAIHSVSCGSGQMAFAITFSDLATDQPSSSTSSDIYQGAIQNSVDGAKGTLRSQTPCKLDNVEGVEYIVDIPSTKSVARSRLFLLGTLFYQINYFGPAGTESDKVATDFLDSFRLLH
jgi:hypothetical protein